MARYSLRRLYFKAAPSNLKKLLTLLCLSLLFYLPACVTMPEQSRSGTTPHLKQQTSDNKNSSIDNKNSPMTFDDHLRLGKIYESNGNLRPALREYQRARRMRKNDSRPYFGIGNIQLRSGELIKAEKSYKKAIRRYSKVGVYYNNLAWVYINQKRYGEAHTMVKKGASLDKGRSYIYLDTMGVIEMRQGNFAVAEQKLKEAVAAMPPLNTRGLLNVYENLHELYTKMMLRTDDMLEVERYIDELKQSLGSTVPMLP